MEQEATPVYILVLSKIKPNSIDRRSYSFVINDFIAHNEEDNRYVIPDLPDLINGITYMPETLPDNNIISYVLKWCEENGQWMDWMYDWTQVTVYMLYQGNTGGIKLA